MKPAPLYFGVFLFIAISPVPAPAAIWLFATGLPVLGALVRRRQLSV